MKRWTRKWIPSLLTAVMLSSVPVSVLSSTAYAETVAQAQEERTYEQHRQAVQDALEAFKKETTVENMKNTIDAFIKLPVLSVYPVAGYQDDKDMFSDDIIKYLSFVTNQEGQDNKSELRMYFAEEAMKLVETTKHRYDFAVAKKIVETLPASDKRTEFASKLDAMKKEVYRDDSGWIDWNNPPDDLVIAPYEPPKDNNTIPGSKDPDYYKPGNGKPKPTNDGIDHSTINYRIEGGKCYKVLEHYKNGKLVKTEKQTPDKLERMFCGASGGHDDHDKHDEHESHNPFPYAGAGVVKYPSSGVFKGFDPFSESERQKLMQEEKKNVVDPITIQYTFEKSLESPYFYDTGIAIAEDKTVTYAQARDALHMIAVQAKGKFVDDKTKALALIDGKIVLVVDRGKPMPFAEFASLFNETNVGVRALDTRSGEQVGMADLVEIKGISSVFVKDKEIKLVSKPIVDNSIVLFPVEQIAKALGGTVTKSDKSITVTNKNHTLVYEDGSSTILSNGKKVDVQVPVRVNKEGVMMAPIRALVDAFDLTIEVEDSKVVIR